MEPKFVSLTDASGQRIVLNLSQISTLCQQGSQVQVCMANGKVHWVVADLDYFLKETSSP